MTVDVTPVRYRPHDDAYDFDVEVFDATQLRARVAAVPERGFERVDFHSFVFVRSGTYSHTVDFETHRCSAGSCLVIEPGQVHRFGPPSEWDGWILIVRSHHLPGGGEPLPNHVRTTPAQAAAIVELFERMAADVGATADPDQLEELLALEARLLVRRLALCDAGSDAGRLIDPVVLERYRTYRAAVDREFRRWHQVALYARLLGCSTKSLNRACQAVAAMTAKAVIVERIVLEGKRRLAYGQQSVSAISSELGFDEPTNFVKFFRRETGLTPSGFRATCRPLERRSSVPGPPGAPDDHSA